MYFEDLLNTVAGAFMRTCFYQHAKAFVIVTAVAIRFVTSAVAQQPSYIAPVVAVNRAFPLTIAMSERGRFARGESWFLSVNSAGKAQLSVDPPRGKSVEFQVPQEEVERLRDLLIQERFFELQEDYGEIVPDGSPVMITIVVGDHSHSVRLHYLMNWVHQNSARLVEPARAVRVGLLIRGWFHNKDAADSQEYDQMVLDAAEKSIQK